MLCVCWGRGLDQICQFCSMRRSLLRDEAIDINSLWFSSRSSLQLKLAEKTKNKFRWEKTHIFIYACLSLFYISVVSVCYCCRSGWRFWESSQMKLNLLWWSYTTVSMEKCVWWHNMESVLTELLKFQFKRLFTQFYTHCMFLLIFK